ncbi:MAG TPA: hypothetical protein VGI06_02495 [Acidimicrobiales bacterium]
MAAVAGGWLAVLNGAAAGSSFPYVLHGRSVEVVIRHCQVRDGARSCRGDYRVGSVIYADREMIGADTAGIGARLRGTVDARHPGTAVVGHPGWALAEAILLALAGAVLGLGAMRAAVRAWRRRRRRPAPAPAPPPAPPRPVDTDDPLASVRRRRFGAGG